MAVFTFRPVQAGPQYPARRGRTVSADGGERDKAPIQRNGSLDWRPAGCQRAHHWVGSIWYKDGDTAAFAHTDIDVHVTRNSYGPVSATVTFSGGGATSKTETYFFTSPYFRNIEFEFDSDRL